MENSKICLICGIDHGRNLCPMLKKNWDKMNNRPKDCYIIGNIVLECIKRGVNYTNILTEITAILYESSALNDYWNQIIQITTDFVVDYFSTILDCRSSLFLKNSSKTEAEYATIINKADDYETYVVCDKKQNICKIEISLPCFNEGYSYIDESTGKIISSKDRAISSMSLIKKFDGHIWKYQLVLDYSYLGSNPHAHLFDNILIENIDGKLKSCFDHLCDYDFREYAVFHKTSEYEYSYWMQELKENTNNGFIHWKILDNKRYFCYFNSSRIELDTDNNPLLNCIYIETEEERFAKYMVLYESTEVEKRSALEMKELEDLILRPIETIIKTKELKYTDVIVSSQTISCKIRGHSLIPYNGIVQLLLPDGEVTTYTIYTGYCKYCNTYHVFSNDFRKMLEFGTPLCSVEYENRLDKQEESRFRYKSQSILNAMGYTVNANSVLESEERHKILTTAIDGGLIDLHDTIDFLHWLVNTRKTRKSYSAAVKKWEKDIEFLENYKSNTRNDVLVNGIKVK